MFTRTPAGIRNQHLFYQNYYLVIVEGNDDCAYWDKLFPEQGEGYTKKIKPVYGKQEVKKYLNEIDNAKFAVALDSDYSFILGNEINHPQVVETIYHSIENLMLCSHSLVSSIRNFSRCPDYKAELVDEWLDYFDSIVYPLMVAEIIIENNKKAVECTGNNCSRFLKKKENPEFDEDKIKKHINDLPISSEEIEEYTTIFANKKPRFYLKGHFVFSAALCFVRYESKRIRGKKCDISNDAFFGMLLSLCEDCISKDTTLKNLQDKAESVAYQVVSLLSE
jgi:hypothetical protein